jgi:hypothetical protein
MGILKLCYDYLTIKITAWVPWLLQATLKHSDLFPGKAPYGKNNLKLFFVCPPIAWTINIFMAAIVAVS